MPKDQTNYEWKLINVLNVRFSQPRIRPEFQDGRTIDEAVTVVTESPFAADSPETSRYDVLLVHPFAPITIIAFKPKHRNVDGSAVKDSHQVEQLGQRAWFSFDNRRLCALQRVAVALWPKRCCVVVRCLDDLENMKACQVRKFTTQTQGKSVEVGFRYEATTSWCWPTAVVQDKQPDGEDEPTVMAEGAFSGDLLDATPWLEQMPLLDEHCCEDSSLSREEAWELKQQRREQRIQELQTETPNTNVDSTRDVSQSSNVADSIMQSFMRGVNSVKPAERCSPLDARANSFKPAERCSPPDTRANPQAGPQLLDFAVGRRAPVNQGSQVLRPCPLGDGWQYVDHSGKVQGPFSTLQMRQWSTLGFFSPSLPMRCYRDVPFVPYGVLFPAPLIPFYHEPLNQPARGAEQDKRRMQCAFGGYNVADYFANGGVRSRAQ